MALEKERRLLVVPGFVAHHEQIDRLERSTAKWKAFGIKSELVPVFWELGDFQTKLDDIKDDLSERLDKGDQVSVLGVSAGGVLAVASLIEEPRVHKVVTVSSRLRAEQIEGSTSVDQVRRLNPSAFEGIQWIEKNNHRLTKESRLKILNTKAISGDTQVPTALSHMEGAQDAFFPPVEKHSDAVKQALTSYAEVIIDFVKAA